MASKFALVAITCLAAIGLSACGTGAGPSGSNAALDSSAAAYGTTASSYAAPTSSYGSPMSAAPSATSNQPGYNAVPCGSSGSGLSGLPSTPGVSVPGAVSCGSAAGLSSGTPAGTDSASVGTGSGTGFSATISDKQTTGLFTKSVLGVSVQVVNNDSQEEHHFVIVSFTLHNNEVAVAYHQVDLTAGADQTLTFPIPTDGSGHAIDADDAHVEVTDSLL